MKKLLSILMAIAVLMFVTLTQSPMSASADELIKNGGFEQGTPTNVSCDDSQDKINDWEQTENSNYKPNRQIMRYGSNYSAATNTGDFLLSFNSCGTSKGGILEQSFNTVPGSEYTLTFYAREHGSVNQEIGIVQVIATGKTKVLDETAQPVGSSWKKYTYTFVANSITTRLQFIDKSSGDIGSADLVLDDVSVTGPVNSPPIVTTPTFTTCCNMNSPFSYSIPNSTFSDTDGDSLTLSATLANGEPLPNWFSFDPDTNTFSGTPPTSEAGKVLEIQVTADDGKGGTASSQLYIYVFGVS
ncbi:MAG: DUF642 domain-containing protein [Okeania sp. SIO3H1]|uniref:putative Ig domain-containing protein n=1 Tax=Okeania sp. SIO1I7 TaxID=2607772 RepID=UPI0013C8FD8A|nr:putative Ig domain-containing protein [Okeania sp. SIO1I7]NEN89189.1 DUF642 domain-containing protein [Okeania sp. SIO3H1]NET26144.1 DUF642 domain-containing protein [Okeania sp. SIO1I7]